MTEGVFERRAVGNRAARNPRYSSTSLARGDCLPRHPGSRAGQQAPDIGQPAWGHRHGPCSMGTALRGHPRPSALGGSISTRLEVSGRSAWRTWEPAMHRCLAVSGVITTCDSANSWSETTAPAASQPLFPGPCSEKKIPVVACAPGWGRMICTRGGKPSAARAQIFVAEAAGGAIRVQAFTAVKLHRSRTK